MKKLRILFDANPLMVSRTGIGYYTTGLIEAIASQYPDEIELVGYYYNFLGRKHPPTSPVASNIRYRPILAAPGPAVNLLRRFGIELPIELLTLMRADFILYPNFLGHPSLFCTPNSPVIHDLAYLDFPEYGSEKNVRDLTRFVPRVLARATFVTTVSQFSKQRITYVYKVPADRIMTTFIPPDLPPMVAEAEKLNILEKRNIKKPYLLFIGTMEPRKNIPALLDAYTQLPVELRGTYSFVLAGKIDWKYQETKAKIVQLQAEGYDIHYLGYIDDDERAALYQGARLLVLASHYEGFGMQILEALSYGVPCAVSDIPVFHEVGGDKVAYFDYKDTASITSVLQTCLEKPASAADLQAYVTSLPTWAGVAKQLVGRIQDELQKRRRHE